MSWIPLQEVAEVFGGYRPATKPAPLVSHSSAQRLLEAHDVSGGRHIQWTSLRTLAVEAPAKYLLRSDDVLVQLRGAKPLSTLLEAPPCPVVVSHRFAIVRPNPHVLLPSFLAAFLRHPETQARIRASSRTSTVRFLSLSELRKLMIGIPSLDVQQGIARADRLRVKFQELRAQHEDLVNQAVDAAVANAIKA